METKTVSIGDRLVGEGQPAFIIAEVSANHRGDISVALRAIENAAKAGADAVKFQHLTGDKIAADIPMDVLWNGKPVGTLSAFYKKSELPYEWTEKLAAHATAHNIIFLSTPFDTEAVDVLAPHVPAYKVASYEMTDDILLRYIAKKKKPVILSTGMAYMEEVEHAVEILRGAGAAQIAVLHCVSMYPPQAADLNLRAITTLRDTLGIPVGFSDHSAPSSILATLGAIALGACIIERHITDAPEGGSHDDKNSMTPGQFSGMLSAVRELEAALGSGVKQPVARPEAPMDEVRERNTRRSLYAARDLCAGEIVTEDMFVTLRPLRGIEPKDALRVIGKTVRRAIRRRAPITWEDLA